MFIPIFRATLYLGFLLLFYSCDSTISPKNLNSDTPFVGELIINPNAINFDPITDGQKDTTLTLLVSVIGENFDSAQFPYYSIFIDNEDLPAYEGELTNINGNIYSQSIDIVTNTITFSNYIVLVTTSATNPNSNYSQAIVKQKGVPINAPEILEVNNPSSIEIPSSGDKIAVFEAKVRDIDGQDNIDKVLINFRNQDGSMLSQNPFELFDDGSSNSGDSVARDSVFTRTFKINSSNTPNNRTALYWAIDKSGLSSDTVETPFNIVNNE